MHPVRSEVPLAKTLGPPIILGKSVGGSIFKYCSFSAANTPQVGGVERLGLPEVTRGSNQQGSRSRQQLSLSDVLPVRSVGAKSALRLVEKRIVRSK